MKKQIKKGITQIARVVDSAIMGGIVFNMNDDTENYPRGTIDINKLIRYLIITALIIYGYSGKGMELISIFAK